jgi:hypothetical protein
MLAGESVKSMEYGTCKLHKNRGQCCAIPAIHGLAPWDGMAARINLECGPVLPL